MISLPINQPIPSPNAQRLLAQSGTFWFVIALAGQAMFGVYILVNYGGSAATGNLSSWNDILFNGLIEGDLVGNLLLMMHLALAFIITASGPLQLIPALRNRARSFHRWNGRAYIFVALLISSGGIILSLSRPAFGGWPNMVLQSFNGAVIFVCALIAWNAARQRNFGSHRRWATRLFLTASGVWFLRVMMMAWAIPTGGAGLGDQLDGPAGRAAMLGQTVLPLAVYQLYLMAEASQSGVLKYSVAGLIVGLTLIMAGGILAASLIMWLPRIVG